jgi:hypothetical protein
VPRDLGSLLRGPAVGVVRPLAHERSGSAVTVTDWRTGAYDAGGRHLLFGRRPTPMGLGV